LYLAVLMAKAVGEKLCCLQRIAERCLIGCGVLYH